MLTSTAFSQNSKWSTYPVYERNRSIAQSHGKSGPHCAVPIRSISDILWRFDFLRITIQYLTRMLAINVSIPNLTVTVARLEQFWSPQLYELERATNRRRSWLRTNHPLYENLMSLSPVRVHFQLMYSPKIGCRGNVPKTLDLGATSSLDSLSSKTHP